MEALHTPDGQRQKLDKKAKKYRFVGYCTQSKGYRLLEEGTKKVVIRRDVVFNESQLGERAQSSQDTESVEVLEVASSNQQQTSDNEQEEETHQSALEQELAETITRRSERHRRPPVRYGCDEYVDLATDDHMYLSKVDHLAYSAQGSEPNTLTEALQSRNSKEWKQAVDFGIQCPNQK